MSKTNKTKSSLTNMIKERAQRPDFLPKSFVEDSTRLAEETIPRSHEPVGSRSPEPTMPDPMAHKTKAFEPIQPYDHTHPGARELAGSRSYAHVVLSTEGPQEEYMLPTRGYPLAKPSATESPYRRNMSRTSTYLAAKAKDQLRAISFNERTSEEDLLREAIDMLFRTRGLPTIAFEGAPSRQQRPH